MSACKQIIRCGICGSAVVHADAEYIFCTHSARIKRCIHTGDVGKIKLIFAPDDAAAKQNDPTHLFFCMDGACRGGFIVMLVNIMRKKTQPERFNARLQKLQNGGEEHAPRSTHDYGCCIRVALLKLARVVVGRIAAFRDYRTHAFPCCFIYPRAAVHNAGNRADPNACALCDIPNCYGFLHDGISCGKIYDKGRENGT